MNGTNFLFPPGHFNKGSVSGSRELQELLFLIRTPVRTAWPSCGNPSSLPRNRLVNPVEVFRMRQNEYTGTRTSRVAFRRPAMVSSMVLSTLAE